MASTTFLVSPAKENPTSKACARARSSIFRFHAKVFVEICGVDIRKKVPEKWIFEREAGVGVKCYLLAQVYALERIVDYF